MRNMAIFRLTDGTLLLHSVIAMHDDGMAALEALGRPSLLVVPNAGHRLDLRFYKSRYPGARVLCPAAARTKVEQIAPVDALCEDALPGLGVRVHPLPGYKNGELAYELELAGGGRALLLGDAAANRDHPPGLGGKVVAAVLGGIRGRLGVPRIVKTIVVSDRRAARASLTGLANLEGVRVVVPAHGKPILDACSEALREAAASL
jgi:glyoxylase-like metal-dependent hydrolase (beta-lactamase superfamily II)